MDYGCEDYRTLTVFDKNKNHTSLIVTKKFWIIPSMEVHKFWVPRYHLHYFCMKFSIQTILTLNTYFHHFTLGKL